jgi:hypothetical protein
MTEDQSEDLLDSLACQTRLSKRPCQIIPSYKDSLSVVYSQDRPWTTGRRWLNQSIRSRYYHHAPESVYLL